MVRGLGYLEENLIQVRMKLLKYDKAWNQKIMQARKRKCENVGSYLSSNGEKQIALFDYFMYKFYVDEEFRKENEQFGEIFKEYVVDIDTLVRKYPFLYDRIPILSTNCWKMLSDDTLKQREKYINQIKVCLTKLNNDDSLTSAEEKDLELYFIGNIPTSDKDLLKLQDKYFKKKINEFASHYSYTPGDDSPVCDMPGIVLNYPITIEFISKYGVYDNLRTYLSFEKMNDVAFFNCSKLDGCPVSWAGAAQKNCVCMNAAKMESFIEKLVDSYHEAKHVHQHSDEAYKAGGPSRDIWYEMELSSLFRNLKTFDSSRSEYRLNYGNQEIEHDANRNAFWRVKQLLSNHPDLCEYLEKEYDEKRKDAISLEKRDIDNSGYRNPWEFKFGHLDKLMSSNPDYLKVYPCFLKFYNDDGTPKGIFDVLCDMKSSDFVYHHNRSAGFMLDYFRYRFSDENFDKSMNDFYNNTKYTPKEITKINKAMENLAKSATGEIDEICNGVIGINDLDDNKKSRVNVRVSADIDILKKCYIFSCGSKDKNFESKCLEYLDKALLNNDKLQSPLTNLNNSGDVFFGSGKK